MVQWLKERLEVSHGCWLTNTMPRALFKVCVYARTGLPSCSQHVAEPSMVGDYRPCVVTPYEGVCGCKR